jgi:hypothetical protein
VRNPNRQPTVLSRIGTPQIFFAAPLEPVFGKTICAPPDANFGPART